jgi:hypothetical protein
MPHPTTFSGLMQRWARLSVSSWLGAGVSWITFSAMLRARSTSRRAGTPQIYSHYNMNHRIAQINA